MITVHMAQKTSQRRLMPRLLSKIINPDLRELCATLVSIDGGSHLRLPQILIMLTGDDAFEGGHGT